MTPLHWVGDILRTSFMGIPLVIVKILFLLLPVVILLWVIALPMDQKDDESRRNEIRLRVGASVALGIQILIYSFA